MPVNSIDVTPNPGSINAAYRPIIFEVTAESDEGVPVVYCDIYLDQIYYKTISKTQKSANGKWTFDVQDAAQEYLQKHLSPNGGSTMLVAPLVTAKLQCKFRGSMIDPTDGFLVPDAPVPVQATLGEAAVAGGGLAGFEIWIVNCTLQHDDNQDLSQHLNSFKQGTWGALTWPMTHRPNRYLICPADSDYFPILSFVEPTSIKLHYRPRNSSVWSDGDYNIPCTPPSLIGNVVLPDSTEGVPYHYEFTVAGTQPLVLHPEFDIKPAWMVIEIIDGNVVRLSGTPDVVAPNQRIYFEIWNCGGILAVDQTIDMLDCEEVNGAGLFNPPPAQIGKVYEYLYTLNGSLPIVLVQGAISSGRFTIELVNDRQIKISGTPGVADGLHDPNYIIEVANCITGSRQWEGSLEIIGAQGQGFSVRVADQPALMKLAPRYIAQVYTSDGSLAVGKTVYTDAAMTTPLTGQDVRLIALATSPSPMYEIDPTTGVIFANTGQLV